MVNHIILAMSTFPYDIVSGKKDTLNLSDFSYEVKEEKKDTIKYTVTDCKSQLEPIPKLMMKMYPEKEEEFIIYELCSSKTLEVKIVEGSEESAVSFFEKRILSCEEKGERSVKFERITLNDLRAPYDAIKEAMEKVRQEYKKVGGHRLWIDTHGGMRDVAQIFSAIVSLLKVDDIVPEQILGIEVGQNDIVDQKGAFEIFDYVSGMNDFINFGNADVLREYYRKKLNNSTEKTEDKSQETDNKSKIEGILDAMTEIAAGTQLCDPQAYVNGIQNLRSSIQKIDADPLLSIFSEYIKKDYGEELIPSNGEEAEIPPLAIIERCLNKGFYQQALTFLESLMPEEFVKQRCIYVEDTEWNRVESAKEKDSKRYLSKEHYLFDTYLFKNVHYAEKDGIPKEYLPDSQPMWAIKKLDEFYRRYSNQPEEFFKHYPDGFKVYSRIYSNIYKKVKKKDNTVERITMIGNIKTDLLQRKITVFVSLLQIHKALKGCRNLFNHCNGSRPKVSEIENVLRLYIIYARKILE